MANDHLKGGIAVITGAASGIGEGIARSAATDGMRVIVADIHEQRAEAVAADIRKAGGDAVAVRTDVSVPAELDRLAAFVQDRFGDVRLLVNNAGIETVGATWELSAERWERTLDINIHGAIHGVRAFAPRMIAAGKPCHIATISSVGGFGTMPMQTAYIVSKHAMLAFSDCLYLEMQLKAPHIAISVVFPGPVATRIFSDANRPDDAASAAHREIMEGMLASQGMTGLEAGRIILDGIAARQFWVSTHPDMTDGMARARADYLANHRVPVLTEDMKALLAG